MIFSILNALLLLGYCALPNASYCIEELGLSTKFAPLSDGAAGVPLNADGYAIVSFGGGAYMVTEGIYQSLILVSTEGVILVDSPPTIGHKLQWAIGNITDLPVKYFIYSHEHADHTGGAFLFMSHPDVITVAHENTAYVLSYMKDPNRPVPQITFWDDYTVRLGNQTLQLSWKGPSHTPGNIFIYASAQRVLMLVDTVFPGWVPFNDFAESSFIPGWFEAHDYLLEYDFDHYLGGHLGRPGTRQDVQLQRDYIHDIYNNCVAAINASATNNTAVGEQNLAAKVFANNPGNFWAMFRVYTDSVSDLCYNMTSKKWLGRLSGQDVYGFSHASTMVESLRIDWDILGPFAVAPN